jgi:hypothetical protein
MRIVEWFSEHPINGLKKAWVKWLVQFVRGQHTKDNSPETPGTV